MTHSKKLSLSFAAAAIAVLMAPIGAQAATVNEASSHGAGLVLSADLSGSSLVNATLPGPVSVFGSSLGAGTAAAGSTSNGTPYVSQGSVANVAIDMTNSMSIVPALGSVAVSSSVGLTATLLEGQASFSNGTQVQGYGGVTGLDLNLGLKQWVLAPAAISLLDPYEDATLFSLILTAANLQTTSSITVVNNELVGSNTLNSFSDLGLTLHSPNDLSLPLVLPLTVSSYVAGSSFVSYTPAANTTVALGLSGLNLTLNEQFNTCTSSSLTCSVETNALHLWSSDPLDGSLVGLDLKLGHSFAQIDNFIPTAVPEPATYAMMGLGLLGVMLGARRKNRPDSQSAKA
jgi:hypothetical protein